MLIIHVAPVCRTAGQYDTIFPAKAGLLPFRFCAVSVQVRGSSAKTSLALNLIMVPTYPNQEPRTRNGATTETIASGRVRRQKTACRAFASRFAEAQAQSRPLKMRVPTCCCLHVAGDGLPACNQCAGGGEGGMCRLLCFLWLAYIYIYVYTCKNSTKNLYGCVHMCIYKSTYSCTHTYKQCLAGRR